MTRFTMDEATARITATPYWLVVFNEETRETEWPLGWYRTRKDAERAMEKDPASIYAEWERTQTMGPRFYCIECAFDRFPNRAGDDFTEEN